MKKVQKEHKQKVEKPFKFFYCIKTETQPSLFAGFPDVKVQVSTGEGHVHFRGRLMCGDSMEAIKNREKAEDSKIAEALPRGIPMCGVCDQKYKEHPDSPWYKWAKSASR